MINKPDPEDSVMVVEITNAILKHLRSTGMYANLSGHDTDYIAFMSHQGTYLGKVEMFKKRVPLNEIHSESNSKAKTTLYKIGPLERYPLKRNSKIPRGRKRITTYEKFAASKLTSDLFKSHY